MTADETAEELGPTYPCLIVKPRADGQLEMQIIGAALLRPGRYEITRTDQDDDDD